MNIYYLRKRVGRSIRWITIMRSRGTTSRRRYVAKCYRGLEDRALFRCFGSTPTAALAAANRRLQKGCSA
jgi:hypothetical protein